MLTEYTMKNFFAKSFMEEPFFSDCREKAYCLNKALKCMVLFFFQIEKKYFCYYVSNSVSVSKFKQFKNESELVFESFFSQTAGSLRCHQIEDSKCFYL